MKHPTDNCNFRLPSLFWKDGQMHKVRRMDSPAYFPPVKLPTKRVNFRSASASWEYEQMYRCTKAEEMPVFFSSFAKVGYDSVCYSLIV